MKKEINLTKFIIVMLILMVIEGYLMFLNYQKESNQAQKMCKIAICNPEDTICFAYDLDSEGNTKIIWQGNCIGK